MDISLALVCRLFYVALCWYDLPFFNLEVLAYLFIFVYAWLMRQFPISDLQYVGFSLDSLTLCLDRYMHSSHSYVSVDSLGNFRIFKVLWFLFLIIK